MRHPINLLRGISLPILAGVTVALIWANVDIASYKTVVSTPLFGGLDLHFLTNDIFMVLFIRPFLEEQRPEVAAIGPQPAGTRGRGFS